MKSCAWAARAAAEDRAKAEAVQRVMQEQQSKLRAEEDIATRVALEIKQREEDRKKGTPPRRYSWSFDEHMKIYEANPDGSEIAPATLGDFYATVRAVKARALPEDEPAPPTH